MGDLALARKHLEGALAEDPHHAPTLLLQGCMALEVGDLQVAEATLARLRSAAPDRLEAELLQRLLAYRARAPHLGWRQAFLLAWTELNRPDFLDSPLLIPRVELPEVRDYIPAEAEERATSTSIRLALVLARPMLTEKNAGWLVEQLPTLEEPALVQAAAAALLPANLPPALHAEARGAVRQRLARLVEASPRTMQPRLLLLWAETPEATGFNERELEALEAIAALPTWKDTSFTRTFLEARAHLKEAGIPHSGMGAFGVALWSNTHWTTYQLMKRAERTRSQLLPGSRHRLGRILWSIGSRLSQQSTVLEHLSGLQLMQMGATDMGKDDERERVEGAMKEARAILHAADRAALERWPLPSLWEEVAEARARDEWAHLQEFAGAAGSHD